MADSNPILKNILTAVEGLSLPDLEKVSIYLEKTLNARRAEAQALLERLHALGVQVTPRDTTPEKGLEAERQGRRQRPEPKYRSKVDPNLVWTGRGRMAGWLVREMEDTGLPPEAFLISPGD